MHHITPIGISWNSLKIYGYRIQRHLIRERTLKTPGPPGGGWRLWHRLRSKLRTGVVV